MLIQKVAAASLVRSSLKTYRKIFGVALKELRDFTREHTLGGATDRQLMRREELAG